MSRGVTHTHFLGLFNTLHFTLRMNHEKTNPGLNRLSDCCMGLSLAQMQHLVIFEVIPSPAFLKLVQLLYFLSPYVNFEVRETLVN